MKPSITRLACACALAATVGALSGTALAGNGNGNSANAPGQAKKESAAPAASTPGQASPGQQKQAARAAAGTPGVKPSNATKHNTTCYTGGSSSSPTCTPGAKADSSKQYGNGKTAAQIAASRGAPAGTKIYGPGNSQPHKVMSCKHPTHGVDVHAVKHYGSQDCTQSAAQQAAAAQPAAPVQPAAVQPAPAQQTPAQQTPAPAAQAASSGATAAAPQAQGGVLGATASLAKPKARPSGGILGAVGNIAGSSLPFTGFPVWAALLIGLALVAVGILMRRSAASPARI